MAGGGAVEDRVVGERHRCPRCQWGEQHRAHGVVPPFASDPLDDTSEQRVAGVAVRPCLAELVEPRNDRRGLGDIAGQAVVAASGIAEDVAVQPAGVVEQVRQRESRVGDRPTVERVTAIGSAEHRDQRLVEGESAIGDEAADSVAVWKLADRADLEQRVAGSGHCGPGVEDAVGGDDPGVGRVDADDGAGDAEAPAAVGELVGRRGLGEVHGCFRDGGPTGAGPAK